MAIAGTKSPEFPFIQAGVAIDAQPLFEGRHGMPGAGAGINEIEQVLGVLLVFWGDLHGGDVSIWMNTGAGVHRVGVMEALLQFSRSLVFGEKAGWHMGPAILG
jgi:hypothetical protein